ncbi:MAG TPA: ABC transporter permease [Mucilaginibacter sp.]
MIKSYLKTAFRFLLKNKTFSFINIFGLATGTLCCLYILLYVQDQYSFDKQHKDVAGIFRITTDLGLTGDKHHGAASSPPISPAIKSNFPEVLTYTRVFAPEGFGVKQHLLRYKEKSFYEEKAYYVDSTFFDIFNYHFAEGQAPHALNNPYDIVLLKSTAVKLFGTESAVGKFININDGFGKHDFRVTGVVDESLGKSHLQANMFINMRSGAGTNIVVLNNEWAGNNFLYAYLKLKPGADAKALEKKLPAFLDKNAGQEMKTLGMTKVLHLQPVAEIHTTGGYEHEPTEVSDPSFLTILMVIAIMIQVVACINFMNLSTARASKRAKEVGVRKVIGAGKYDLIKQFLGESFLLSFIGVAIALPLLALLLPSLNNITHSNIQLSVFADYRIWLMLSGLVLVTGFVAGSYPAFYLSAFEAIKVIKGNFTSRVSAAGIRRGLVVFQFVLSIVLITGIIIIYSQLNFIKSKDLGFDQNQKLVFNFYTDDAVKQMPSLTNDLRALADVKTVSSADNYLGQFVPHDHGVYPEGGNMATAVDAQNIIVDEYFRQANGIKLLAGRDFMKNDTGKVLINQTMAKRLGFNDQNAVGAKLYQHYGNQPVTYVTVAGVMKDFNYNSLHNDVRPFMLVYDNNPGNFNCMVVSTSSKDYKTLLSKIAGLWKKDLPQVPFTYTFLDSEVQKQYQAEIILSQIINSFTLIAILISCLGLFGLAAFSAEQRSKEIGIRKVLGSSVSGIVTLLSKDFLILVIISFILATPIAYYGMSKWLQAFVYRVPLAWWMFGMAGALAAIIALLTVSSQAIKAALTNPVKSLKSE